MSIRTNPSGVTSVEASPPGVSFESIIIHDGPSYRRISSVTKPEEIQKTYQLMQTFRGSQTSRTSSNDQDIDRARCQSANWPWFKAGGVGKTNMSGSLIFPCRMS